MEKNALVGHEQVIEHLTSSVKVGKISHAYIFHGENGAGKAFIARYYAKLLQCENPVVTDGSGPEKICACGKCRSCLQSDGGNQPDIIYVTHEKASLGVDDVRLQVNADIAVKPYSSRYKIYIVDDADKMTEAAQNAILKTIEEPPEYGVIILLADNTERLLQTIHSRCTELQIKPSSKTSIKRYLVEALGIDEYQADMAAVFSGGNVGRAIRYATDEDFAKVKSDITGFLRNLDSAKLPQLMETVKNLSSYKMEIKDCIDLMILWLRDILSYKATGDANILIYREEYRYIRESARLRSYESLERAIRACEKAKKQLDSNVNFDVAIELMLMDMTDK